MRDVDRRKTVAALVDSDSLTTAAQVLGISRQALYGRLQADPSITQEYQRLIYRQCVRKSERLNRARDDALEQLCAICADANEPGSTRTAAARVIMTAAQENDNQLDTLTTAAIVDGLTDKILGNRHR